MIVRRGTYNNLNWFQMINDMGGKCAYVAVPIDRFDNVFKTHAKFDKQLFSNLAYPDEIDDLDGIHGGCTYLSQQLPGQIAELPDESVVIGWDYCHFDDINMRFDYVKSSGKVQLHCKYSDDQIQDDIRLMIDSFVKNEQHAK